MSNSFCLEFLNDSGKENIFYSQNFRTQKNFFFSLKALSFLFVGFNYENKQNIISDTFDSGFEIFPNQNSVFMTQNFFSSKLFFKEKKQKKNNSKKLKKQ